MAIKEKFKKIVKKNKVVYKNILLLKYFLSKKGPIKRCVHYIFRGHFLSKIITNNYIKKSEPIKKLQVGGGYHTKRGWLNADILSGDIYLNATKKHPIKSHSFNYIFSEQFLEHLNLKNGKFHLSECYRILKAGGKIRIATPDLDKLISLYNKENSFCTQEDAVKRHFKDTGGNHDFSEFFNDMFHSWGHKFIYNLQTLGKVLESSGFKNVKRVNFGESTDKNLKNLERHADIGWMKNAYSLIIEAEKQNI